MRLMLCSALLIFACVQCGLAQGGELFLADQELQLKLDHAVESNLPDGFVQLSRGAPSNNVLSRNWLTNIQRIGVQVHYFATAKESGDWLKKAVTTREKYYENQKFEQVSNIGDEAWELSYETWLARRHGKTRFYTDLYFRKQNLGVLITVTQGSNDDPRSISEFSAMGQRLARSIIEQIQSQHRFAIRGILWLCV